MKLRLIPIIFIAVCMLASCACAQEDDSDFGDYPSQPSCIIDETTPYVIESPNITGIGSVIRASDGVFFMRGNQRVKAGSVQYDTATGTAVIQDAMFTTCASSRPDYRIEAREVTLLPNGKMHAKGASIYIGRIRVLYLPSLKLRVSGNQASRNFFPSIGYDSDDGLRLSQKFRIIDQDRLKLRLNASVTTENEFEGDLRANYGLDGKLGTFTGRKFTYGILRGRALDMPVAPFNQSADYECAEAPDVARLRAFGTFTLKQRTYDINNTGLLVYRQPEVGLTYTAPHINLSGKDIDPRMQIYPTAHVSWGRFKESPGRDIYTNRENVSAIVPIGFAGLAKGVVIHPVVGMSSSHYGTGDNYNIYTFGADISKSYSNGSFASLRYLSRHDSGFTPFEFDNIDIRQELQAAFQARVGKNVVGFTAGYDLNSSEVYDWAVMYGYRTDCIASWAQWNQRLHRFSMHVALINF